MTNSVAPTRRRGSDKRDRLVAAATQLLLEQGIERTTLADVAAAANVPVGNVYYYFKTKDDLVAAVVTGYIERAKAVLHEIEIKYRTPKARLRALVRQLTAHGDQIAETGCPVGTLCSELGKRAGIDLSQSELMKNPLVWAEDQFRSLGRTDARELSQQLMADYEGSASSPTH
jgi:TetR/AcrR family transcriptional regulator, transcriptional repressor for nem operon